MVGSVRMKPSEEKHVANQFRHVRCRAFLYLMVAAAVTATPLTAQNPEFDLLIAGGHVIDPKNGVNAVMDVAISGGKVAQVAANIARARAREVADASGLY